MSAYDTSKITLLTSSGIESIRNESDKLVSLLTKELDDLNAHVVEVKRQIQQDSDTWEKIKNEIEILTDRLDLLKQKEEEINKRIIQLDEDEKANIELHKVLENRRKILDAREKELQEKKRRF